jgi:hypothetical protein
LEKHITSETRAVQAFQDVARKMLEEPGFNSLLKLKDEMGLLCKKIIKAPDEDLLTNSC